MAKDFTLTPQDVAPVSTRFRTIKTAIPAPGDVETVKEMRKYEPVSMTGQPPIVWDRAENFTVHDRWGNRWIDFSSGVVVTSAGHSNPDVKKAIIDMAAHDLQHTYCFPNEARGKLVKKISELVPIPDNRVFLLTTGAESTECAIKLARTHGEAKGGNKKIKVITFDDSFHGRTMGSQMAGGSVDGKKWIVNLDKDMHQVPFPNAFKYEWADERSPGYSDDKCFAEFLKHLEAQNVAPDSIAGVMTETFQGGWVQFMPAGFAKKLREFCTKHDILLIFDEVQAGFARTGKWFGFMHLGVTPDVICCGKGITSGMPLSCVVGRGDIMNLYGPNKMTSTHSGNPICSAAALANIDYMIKHDLVGRSAKVGDICRERLAALQKEFSDIIGFVSGYGSVWAVVFTKPGTKEMHTELAQAVVETAYQKGLLFFAPVGSGSTIKICPAITIDEDALREGLDVLRECVREAMKKI